MIRPLKCMNCCAVLHNDYHLVLCMCASNVTSFALCLLVPVVDNETLTHSIPGTDIYLYTASQYIAIVLIRSKSACAHSRLLATTTSWLRQHNIAPMCGQFSTGFDTHMNLSELLQNSWSEAESVLGTAGVK